MKQRTVVAVALAVWCVGGLAAAGPAGRAATAEDDLAIVKKAVASPSPVPAREPRPVASSVTASARAARAAAPAAAQAAVPAPASEARLGPRSGREPQWFKVRIVERSSGRKKVTVNLPLSLVRALGDDTLDWGCRDGRDGERCHTMRISDVLRSLEAGQELVEIEDEDSTVKVWVE